MEHDAIDQLQRERTRRESGTFAARRRKHDGPILANEESLHAHGLHVGYGHNSAGAEFAALFRDGRRLTNWARL